MSKIDICNEALSYIGVQGIERIDEASEQARCAKQFYDRARTELLRRYNWEFATRRKHLALVDGDTTEFKYRYRYPADAIAIRGLIRKYTLTRDNKYIIMGDDEGKLICTNEEAAFVEYTYDVKDDSLFDTLFTECLAWLLAHKMAFRLTGKMDIANNAMQMYATYFAEATGGGAREDKQPEPEVQNFVSARFHEVKL